MSSAPVATYSPNQPTTRPTRVLVAIAIALFTMVASMMLLYARWVRDPDITSVIILEGSPKLGETQIWVRPKNESQGLQPGRLQADNQFKLKVFRPPGIYVVGFSTQQSTRTIEVDLQKDETAVLQLDADGTPQLLSRP